jgi:hypothetical protein
MLNKMTKMALAGALMLGTASAALAGGNTGPNRGTTYGFANGVATHGEFINGNFIPRGTSLAQVPSHHEEDNYGPDAGKD